MMFKTSIGRFTLSFCAIPECFVFLPCIMVLDLGALVEFPLSFAWFSLAIGMTRDI